MCRAYGGEPTVNLLRSFLNLGRAGDWLTLSNRGSADVPIALVKLITHLVNWKDSFLYVESRIIPSDYPELLLESNKFDKKIFWGQGLKNSWKHSPKEPVIYYQGQEMDFRSFMMQEIDGEFKFLPEGCIDDNQGSPSSKSINNEALIINAKPVTSLHPSNFFEDVADSNDSFARDNENPLLGTSLPPLLEACKKLKSLGKRKLPSGLGILFRSDADIHDMLLLSFRIANCHWVVAHVSPPFWNEHLHQISIKQLCDIHDRAYMRQVVLDNVLNSRTQELISALHKATASYDVIRASELEKDKAYAELERKCNKALLDLNKNPLSKIKGLKSERERLKLSEIQPLQEMDVLKQDRASVVAKVVLDAATKLIRSDEMGMLVAKLVKASIIYGRCAAFEEVAKLKEPFIMEKMADYRPSSKQEYDQAGDDLANASYPFFV
ncbi:hypothetical protein Tco_0456597 [Tanacetum coccineum]